MSHMTTRSVIQSLISGLSGGATNVVVNGKSIPTATRAVLALVAVSFSMWERVTDNPFPNTASASPARAPGQF